MTSYLDRPIGDRTPELITAVIELPQRGINKYEYDKKLHVLRLDRNLHSPVHYPGDYGFIPQTFAEDGDPLDILALGDSRIAYQVIEAAHNRYRKKHAAAYRGQSTMERSNIGVELNQDYVKAVERTAELERLVSRAHERKHLLVFGPEGVGKTRLLQEFARIQPLALYVRQSKSPHDLLLSLVESLRAKLGVRSLPSHTSSMSTSGLKATVDRALSAKPFLLLVDHLQRPSRVVAKIVKDLGYYGRTPIFFGARSPHMEDIGALQALCYDKKERLEMMNWPSEVALEFARRHAERVDLRANNLDAALHSIVQLGGGNPGSILGMLNMASRSQYRVDDQIKFHVLYLDYRMGRR